MCFGACVLLSQTYQLCRVASLPPSPVVHSKQVESGHGPRRPEFWIWGRFEKWKMCESKGRMELGHRCPPSLQLSRGKCWHLWAEVVVLCRPEVARSCPLGHYCGGGHLASSLRLPLTGHCFWSFFLSRKTRHLPGPHSLSSTAQRTSHRLCHLCRERPPSFGTLQ